MKTVTASEVGKEKRQERREMVRTWRGGMVEKRVKPSKQSSHLGSLLLTPLLLLGRTNDRWQNSGRFLK